jgi:hypothetical protein
MKRINFWGATAVLLAAAAAGCDADNQLGAQRPLVQDGGAGDACVGPAAASLCPAIWDAARTQIVCSGFADQVNLGDDGTYLVRSEDRGSGVPDQIFCVYDHASGALVGARREALASDFCGGTSAEIYSGVASWALVQSFVANLPAPQCPSTGQCHVGSSPVPCPPTWEQAQAAPACAPTFNVVLGRAGGYLARGSADLLNDYACYYDALTHAFVGASVSSRVHMASFCEGASFDELFGDVHESLPVERQADAPPCPPSDAGAD